MEAKAITAMVCLSEGMTLTTNITQMSNFQYTDSNEFIEGTSFDDRIMLQQGIAGGNNGFIDGGSGFDTFYIQESSSDWNLWRPDRHGKMGELLPARNLPRYRESLPGIKS